MPLTSIERHNLINKAGEVAGKAVALIGVLANEGAPVVAAITGATQLARAAAELEDAVMAEAIDAP